MLKQEHLLRKLKFLSSQAFHFYRLIILRKYLNSSPKRWWSTLSTLILKIIIILISIFKRSEHNNVITRSAIKHKILIPLKYLLPSPFDLYIWIEHRLETYWRIDTMQRLKSRSTREENFKSGIEEVQFQLPKTLFTWTLLLTTVLWMESWAPEAGLVVQHLKDPMDAEQCVVEEDSKVAKK